MGNAPLSSKLPAPSGQPTRPFESSKKTTCLRQNFLLTKSPKDCTTTLQQLILHQDWQRVLIRMHLYPDELRQRFEIHVYDMDLQVYPLQLVCALDPPGPVVALCLKLFPDAATMPLRVLRSTTSVAIKGNRRWHSLRRSWKSWRSRRRGAFPVDEDEWSTSVEQRQLLLPFVQDDISEVLPDDDDFSHEWSDPGIDDMSSDSSSSSSFSSKHSIQKETNKEQAKNVILQLSPSGGLAPLPVNTSNETESTSASSMSSIYRVKWDLKPLWTHVAERGTLLALHIACLFQASAEVVEVLVQTYPLAALSDVLGMLPIHYVAAGFTLPPLQPPPTSPVAREPKPGPLHSLHVLRRALPECIHIRSGNHGMIAQDYIRECMEEGEYKQVCLRVLSDGIDYMVEYGSFVSVDSLVFCDTDETSSYPSLRFFAGLSGLILEEEWAKAIAVVEEDPLSARKWYYGVDTDVVGATVWKRLPIHLSCANGAPVGLIDLLLKVFPESAVTEDPHDGMLPLHIACRGGATLPVVKRLVDECPEVCLAVDGGGRTPLHVAVLSKAPFQVVEYLLYQDVESIVALDQHGKTPMDYAMEIHGGTGTVVELLTAVLLKLERW